MVIENNALEPKLFKAAWASTIILCIYTIWSIQGRTPWLDEQFTLYLVNQSWSDLFYVLKQREANMSLYYVILKLFSTVSDSIVFLRLVSFLFIVLGALYLQKLAVKIGVDKAISYLSVIIFFCFYLIIRHAQELRGYGLLILMSIVTTYYLVSYLKEKTVRSASLYVGSIIFLEYSHMYGVILVACQLGYLLVVGFKENFKATMAFGVIFSLGIVPLLIFYSKLGDAPISWVPEVNISNLKYFVFGLYAGEYDLGIVHKLPIIVLIAGAAMVSLWRLFYKKEGNSWLSAPGLFCLYFSFTPLVLLLPFSLVTPVLVPRFFIFVLPFTSLLIAYSVNKVSGLKVGLVLFIMLTTAGFSANKLADKQGDDWQRVGEIISNACSSNDAIYVYRKSGLLGITQVMEKIRSACSGIELIPSNKISEFYKNNEDLGFTSIDTSFDKVWYVSYFINTDEQKSQDESNRAKLQSAYSEETIYPFGAKAVLIEFNN